MWWHTRVLGALVLGLVLAGPASAQDKPVTIALRSGGFNSLSQLNAGGTANLKKVGYDVGGSVGVDLSRYLGVRADFTFARNQLRQNGIDSGKHLNRSFFDAALQVRYPASNGLRPYAFLGGGGVALDPAGSAGFFIEGKSWLYKLEGLNGSLASYDRTQFDIAWSAGLSYRLPVGGSAAAQASR